MTIQRPPIFLFKDKLMSRYDDAAGNLQRAVKHDELDNLDREDYSEAQARQSVAHTRQDIVLIVSHLSSLNKQAATIRLLLWAAVALLGLVAISIR